VRILRAHSLFAWLSVFSGLTVAAPLHAAAASQASGAEVTRLEREVERLEASRAVKHLQRAYGFYMDRALYQEASDLFAPDATLEIGSDGVYAGRERISEYLRRVNGGKGMPWGRLNEHYQLQPVIHIDASGARASGRWRDFGLLGEYGKSATWTEGVFENEYVKRDGVWMIQTLHLYVTFIVPYEQGWSRARGDGPVPQSAVAREFPPDRPATHLYKAFPASDIAPFHYRNPATEAGRQPPASAEGQLGKLWRLADRLRSHDEIENLQGVFGYYFDKNLWSDVAALFTSNGTYEYGQQGVYQGRQHIEQALKLFGPTGPQRGWMNHHFQLQPVIHVSDDGRSARGRWESVMQLARPNTSGAWGLGVYENEYTREQGRWKLSKVHFYVTALTDYDLMWAKGPIPLDPPSSVLPPDRPPTEAYRSLPGVYIPPFHYPHPVTGKPIVTDPQPTDSIVRPK